MRNVLHQNNKQKSTGKDKKKRKKKLTAKKRDTETRKLIYTYIPLSTSSADSAVAASAVPNLC